MSMENSAKRMTSGWTRVLKKQARDFCTETGLHGYKFMVVNSPSKTERILWGITVFSALSCAAVLMHTAWVYNSSRATSMIIESTHHGIWNYPFPAVTICNLNRVSLSRATEFVRSLKLPNTLSQDYVISQIRLLLELTDPGVFGENLTANRSALQEIFDDNGKTITDVINAVSQNCSNLLLSCKWKGKLTSCKELFSQSLSREGLCCSFNYIASSTDKRHPKRLTACGYQTGLTVLLNPDPADYFATTLGAYGAKIMLHAPHIYPDRNAETKIIGAGSQVFLSVSPEETHATRGVKKLAIKSRKCIFPEEANELKHSQLIYSKYAYTNCVAECRAIIMKRLCECIPYYYPQNGTKICTLADVDCLKYQEDRIETSFPGTRLSSQRLTDSKYRSGSTHPCGCQSVCSLYRYPVEASSGVLDTTHTYNHEQIFKGWDMTNKSLVHVFFSDLVSIQYRRNLSYDWRHLFASFGGLLGLFAGFSLMSGFELIYFFVIRLVADSYMQQKRQFST